MYRLKESKVNVMERLSVSISFFVDKKSSRSKHILAKDGSDSLPDNCSIENNRISFQNVSLSDKGSYTISNGNPEGIGSAKFELNVMRKFATFKWVVL